MNDSITIEPVPGTAWVVGYNPAGGVLTVAQALAPYASPRMASTWRDRISAQVAGRCRWCRAVLDIPAEAKTAAPGRPHRNRPPLRHKPDCRCADGQFQAMERACSPDHGVAYADTSESALDLIDRHLRQILQRHQ